MPYIAAKERPAIDEKVAALAQEISGALGKAPNNDTDVSVAYRRAFVTIAKTLLQLEKGRRRRGVPASAKGRAQALAKEVFGGPGKAPDERGAWLGRLNYALTRLIQVVPEKLVEEDVWKEEFRYWVYAQTVGALARAAMEVHASGGDVWAADGLVGVLVDVKDEYKRRVNAAYESVQIKKAGDCYDVRYRTQLFEARDASGSVIGYTEVMRDFGTGG